MVQSKHSPREETHKMCNKKIRGPVYLFAAGAMGVRA